MLGSTARFGKRLSSVATRAVTVIPGDGIGPEITEAVLHVLRSTGTPLEFDMQRISTTDCVPGASLISDETLDSIKMNKIAIKGPLATPIGKGHASLNLTLRREFGLFANVRPCLSIPGLETRYKDVDLVTVRENTEGEYSGIEHEVTPGVCELMKVVTRTASERVARYAFEFASSQGRSRVSAIHKATIQKLGDGMFLDCCRGVAKDYPHIEYEESSLDKTCMELVMDPSRYDVMVMPNLYGDIVSDLCAGLVGGLGVTPSSNIGTEYFIAEAVHGTAPDIAGQGKANPTALMLSSVMMLRHMNLMDHANAIESATKKVLRDGKMITGDLGGKATTMEFAEAISQVAQGN